MRLLLLSSPLGRLLSGLVRKELPENIENIKFQRRPVNTGQSGGDGTALAQPSGRNPFYYLAVNKQLKMNVSRKTGSILLMSLLALTLVHCKGETASAPPPPLLHVEVADVVQKDVPIHSEWVGTTDGMVNAAIRAQVTGYLMKRPYAEGSFVKKGDLLFELDPSKFRASLDQAQGDLAKAEAQLLKTKQDVERDTPLAKQGAISQKELDDSIQAHAAARGNTAAAKAAVEQAKLNLGWTRVTAPIDGVVGIAKAQIGDLIDANSELTSMSTLDPIKV